MSQFGLIIILSLVVGQSILANEFIIELSEDVQEKFPDGFPLQVSSERKNGQVLIKISNRSKKFVAITKHSYASSFTDIFPEGTKEPTSGGFGMTTFPQYLDHIVLSPSSHPAGSTRVVARYSATHEQAIKHKISFSLGGIFPSVEEYTTFSITGEFDYEPKKNP